ncbi:MAG: glycosyltransferase family 4 protein [Pseudorhizobium sp.]
MQAPSLTGLRLLMTVDAIGGVWRYAMDLAAELKMLGVETVFVCLGPAPSAQKAREANAIGRLLVVEAPLDWLVESAEAVAGVPSMIADLSRREQADLLHLNLPSQAAGLETDIPVVTVSHSCVVTWFAGVRQSGVPEAWEWQLGLNRSGLQRADAVISPSRSHAEMLEQAYGSVPHLQVVHNGSRITNELTEKKDMVFAAGRWWDDGKNGAVLEAAAKSLNWPLIMAGSNAGPNGQHLPIVHASHEGELTHDETVALMRQAKIVVSPSIYEPFGLAPLEAARAGAALVLSDIPTYRELWDGCALFADPRDPEAFRSAISRLSSDAGLRATLAVKAYERSLRFTVSAQARAMAAIYERLVTRSTTLSAAE